MSDNKREQKRTKENRTLPYNMIEMDIETQKLN